MEQTWATWGHGMYPNQCLQQVAELLTSLGESSALGFPLIALGQRPKANGR